MTIKGKLTTIPNWTFGLFILTILLVSPVIAGAESLAFTTYAKSPVGKILFLRHALAPGNGDPAHFSLDNCLNQRNLDAAGRQQASIIGALFRQHGLVFERIYSSQWCRCRETAKLLDIGPVVDLPGLNSFYQGIVPRKKTLDALRRVLSNLPSDGAVTLMVTHYVTISAITGIGVASGEAVAFDPTSGLAIKLDLDR